MVLFPLSTDRRHFLCLSAVKHGGGISGWNLCDYFCHSPGKSSYILGEERLYHVFHMIITGLKYTNKQKNRVGRILLGSVENRPTVTHLATTA